MRTLLSNGAVNTCSRQRINMQQRRNCCKQCFLCEPCRSYVRRTNGKVSHPSPVETGTNASTVTLRCCRRWRKGNPVPELLTGSPSSWGIYLWETGPPGGGSLEIERVKYGHESRETQTREWLSWRGPAAIVNDRSDLCQRGRNPQLSDNKKYRFCTPDVCLTPWKLVYSPSVVV
jgi:hypothetical protein